MSNILDCSIYKSSMKMTAPNTRPFLILPAEIRFDIYRNLLVDSKGIDIDCIRTQRDTKIPSDDCEPCIQVDILCTSKAVHHEASTILYGENMFFLSYGGRLQMQNTLNAFHKFRNYSHLVRCIIIVGQSIQSSFAQLCNQPPPPMNQFFSILSIEVKAFENVQSTTHWMGTLGQWLNWMKPEQVYIKVHAHPAFDVQIAVSLYNRWAALIPGYQRTRDSTGCYTHWEGGICLARIQVPEVMGVN
jgi:hypothetical protein